MCGRVCTSSMSSADDRGTRERMSYEARVRAFLEPGTGSQCLAGPLRKGAAGVLFGILFDSVGRVACR